VPSSGKFGYEYPVASAIMDGQVLKSTFSDEAFTRMLQEIESLSSIRPVLDLLTKRA